MEAQTRLLRVLQQGEYTTVGGRTPIKSDVRIIAASNKDLRLLIQQGLFREDLFFRLNVVPLRLPPLRERIEDVPDLIRHFFAQAQREGLPPKQIDPAGLDRLKRHRWPGNVRELENLARRLAALYPQETITAAVIEAELAQPALPASSDEPRAEESLSAAVERHLTAYFAGFDDGLPPAGLYHRVLREIEYPLADRRRLPPPAAIRSAPPTCWGSIAIRCARKSATSTFRFSAAAASPAGDLAGRRREPRSSIRSASGPKTRSLVNGAQPRGPALRLLALRQIAFEVRRLGIARQRFEQLPV